MKIITYTDFKKKLVEFMDVVHVDNSPIIITKRNFRSTVLMSLNCLNKYNADSAEQETSYLLSNPKNAKRLRRSIADAKAGRLIKKIEVHKNNN